MAVDRCVCLDIPFTRLKQIARERSLGFEALCEATQCCSSCGLCAPYVKVMLRTGETSIPLMTPAEARALMRDDKPMAAAQGR